jgi:hypothetical protein
MKTETESGFARKWESEPGESVLLSLTPVEVLDLRMLRVQLLRVQAEPWSRCDWARDATAYRAVVEKILSAV